MHDPDLMNTLPWLALLALLAVGGCAWWFARRLGRQREAVRQEAELVARQALHRHAANLAGQARLEAEQRHAAEVLAAQKMAEQAAARAANEAAEQASQLAALQQAEKAAREIAEQARRLEVDRLASERASSEALRLEARRQDAEHRAAEQAALAAQAADCARADAAAEAQRLARLTLDRAAGETSAGARGAVTASPPAAPHQPDAKLVMVADDSKVVRVKASRLLAQHGYNVVLAEDGLKAAQLLDVEIPLVLITDVEMPGMDGFELTRYVRRHPRAAHIPIIMITSADERLKAAAIEAGVTLVLGKPYAEEALLRCIEQAQATKEPAVTAQA